jgi:uncharacterized integral membrane protein
MDAMEAKAPRHTREAEQDAANEGKEAAKRDARDIESLEVERKAPAASVGRTAVGLLVAHWKLALAVIAAALLLVLVVQNAQVISVRLLFWRLQVSQAMLLFLALLVGGLLGVALRSRRRADVRDAASRDR